MTVSAAPAEVGVHQVVLLFCVKDNPEIVTVNIACSGVLPVVEILPLTKVIGEIKIKLHRQNIFCYVQHIRLSNLNVLQSMENYFYTEEKTTGLL